MDKINYDLIIKVATVCIGLVGAARVMYDWSIGKKGRLRDEYKFAKDFLNDISQPLKIHPYARDKGYQAIAGDTQISGEEVEYLLSLNRPERALRDYVLGKKYLEHLPDSGNLQIKFKKKYERKFSRQWRMYGYLVLYIIFVFAAFTPIIFSSYLEISFQNSIFTLVISLSVFGPYAWFFVQSGAKIYRAQMLVNHQDRHTQRILLSVPMKNWKPNQI